MSEAPPTIFVVDDDPSVRESLESLLKSMGRQVRTYASAQEFLSSELLNSPGCLVLDVRFQGLSGLDLQRDLAQAKCRMPIIFISGHADIPMTVQAIKAGAVEFLTKPFREQDLLDAIQQALESDREIRHERDDLATLQGRYTNLTNRQREVMGFVVSGRLNKQIAAALGVSEATVKVHRGQTMQKMHAESLADLVRIAQRLEVPIPRAQYTYTKI